LPGVVTSNTLQDATEAWYRFKNGGFHKLVAVTSDYHAERVAMILGRLSGNDDAEIEVVSAETPAGYQGADRALEPAKIARLKRDWVDVIPRNANVPPERLVAVYADAGRERQHFDNLSVGAALALLLVNAFAFLIVPGRGGWTLVLLLLLLLVIDVLVWAVYWRFADAASTAGRLLTRMETEHRMPGFWSNWRTGALEWYRSAPWLWPMKYLVTGLAAALFLAVVVASWAAESGETYREYPSRSVTSNSNSSTSPTPYVSNTNGNALDRWANRITENNSNANSNRRR